MSTNHRDGLYLLSKERLITVLGSEKLANTFNRLKTQRATLSFSLIK